MNSEKIILDLCGGTGSWSKPYRDAGYDVRVVTLPSHDVKTYEPPPNVYGILAAPPCTHFSMCRTVAKTPRDLVSAMSTVEACLKIIWKCQYGNRRLSFWALENPKARLIWFLGKPALTFNPYDYGDPYRKPTCLWGNFNTDLKVKKVDLNEGQRKQSQLNLQELPKLPSDYVIPGDTTKRQAARSVTPSGFAQNFYEANK